MATALITGATGLIGRRVVELWPTDLLELVIADRAGDDLLAPGAPRALVDRHRPQVVVHLAWSASSTPGYRDATDNALWVRASVELADAAHAIGARTYATGSALDLHGGDAYASAKAALRTQLSGGVERGEVTWLRPHYVVSPEAGWPRVVADAVRAAERGEPVFLRTPQSVHDFIHLDDVARAVVASVQHGLRGTIDVGSGTLRSVIQLVRALGAEPAAPALSDPAEAHNHAVVDTAALTAVGWRPTSTEELFHHG